MKIFQIVNKLLIKNLTKVQISPNIMYKQYRNVVKNVLLIMNHQKLSYKWIIHTKLKKYMKLNLIKFD